LLVLNVLVFAVMVASGISPTEPTGQDIIRFGSNFGAYTIRGQYWRLLTYNFVHIGFIHLFLNMWFLFDLGKACERLLGSLSFIAMYLVSGVAGGVLSLAWNPHTNSAGASGALFGILGAMIAAYKFGDFSMPRAYVQASLRSMVFCAGINLLWGLSGGIDNAAHIGGMISGMAFGFLFAKAAPDSRDLGRRALITVLIACSVAGGFAFIRRGGLRPQGSAERAALLMQSGRRDEAIAELRAAVAKSPNDPKWRMWLGSALSGGGQSAEALEQFQWVVAHGKPGEQMRDSAAFAIRFIYIAQKDYANGEKYFRGILQSSPNDAISRFALGQLLALQDRHDEAIDEYKSANTESPNDPMPYVGMARSYAKIGKRSEAIAAYKKAIELEGNSDQSDELKDELNTVMKSSTAAPEASPKK